MSKRLRSLLLIFLLSSALMLTFAIDAYEPSVAIGKPSLQDILYSPDGMEPGECGFYSSHTGELISSITGIRDLQFTPDGRYMFMVDDEWQLGLYLTSDVLGKSISSVFAVHPSGKRITTVGYIKRNQVLQNYPNPFNPETWIPYHLEKDSEVTIRIYNTAGELIRTLPLGKKSAGAYLTNSEAAHWDGKNETGEQAASDVYFYTIQADDFSATKKMTMRK